MLVSYTDVDMSRNIYMRNSTLGFVFFSARGARHENPSCKSVLLFP